MYWVWTSTAPSGCLLISRTNGKSTILKLPSRRSASQLSTGACSACQWAAVTNGSRLMRPMICSRAASTRLDLGLPLWLGSDRTQCDRAARVVSRRRTFNFSDAYYPRYSLYNHRLIGYKATDVFFRRAKALERRADDRPQEHIRLKRSSSSNSGPNRSR